MNKAILGHLWEKVMFESKRLDEGAENNFEIIVNDLIKETFTIDYGGMKHELTFRDRLDFLGVFFSRANLNPFHKRFLKQFLASLEEDKEIVQKNKG